jgi:hypothetical protein
MVYYFSSDVVSPAAFIYVGKDKVESKASKPFGKVDTDEFLDEELIKYGLEEDVWFHVDKLSSAHIYLRMNEGETWDAIPEDLLADCAQLTKANSIEGSLFAILSMARNAKFMSGNRKDNITVIYTPWSNLKKDGSMAVGQVSFKDNKKVSLLSFDLERAFVTK